MDRKKGVPSDAIKINPCKIPYGVCPAAWIDRMVEECVKSYGLLERGKQLISITFYELYTEAGVFVAQNNPDWKDVVPELSRNVTYKKLYEKLSEARNSCDPKSDLHDAYSRLLNRFSEFGREGSSDSIMYGDTEGIGIDEMPKTLFSIFVFDMIASWHDDDIQ